MNFMTRFVYLWADLTVGRVVLFYYCPSACPTKSRCLSRCSLPHSFILPTATHSGDTSTLLLTRTMQHASDADHLAYISDAIYPVGPDASGEITYVHIPPLSPLTSACATSFFLAPHVTSYARTSTRRSPSLHGGRRIHLLLRLSPDTEVLRRKDSNGQGSHQTAGPGLRALAIRPADRDDAPDDAAASRALRRPRSRTRTRIRRAGRAAGQGYAHCAPSAGGEPFAGLAALALDFALPLVVGFCIVVAVTYAYGGAADVLAGACSGGLSRPGRRGHWHSGADDREPHDAEEGRRWPL